jgi:hypothetical protein
LVVLVENGLRSAKTDEELAVVQDDLARVLGRSTLTNGATCWPWMVGRRTSFEVASHGWDEVTAYLKHQTTHKKMKYATVLDLQNIIHK